MRRAAALHAHLHDALVLARRGQHRLPFGDVHADRLLNVDVGAGLRRLDHRQRVPVIGRGDEDDVEILLREHLAIIAERARRFLRGLPRRHLRRGVGEHSRIDVA